MTSLFITLYEGWQQVNHTACISMQQTKKHKYCIIQAIVYVEIWLDIRNVKTLTQNYERIWKKCKILQLIINIIHQACACFFAKYKVQFFFIKDLEFLLKIDNILPAPLPPDVEPQGAPTHLPSSPGLMSSAHLKKLQRSCCGLGHA
jgi:hypothetical protein